MLWFLLRRRLVSAPSAGQLQENVRFDLKPPDGILIFVPCNRSLNHAYECGQELSSVARRGALNGNPTREEGSPASSQALLRRRLARSSSFREQIALPMRPCYAV